MVVPVFKMFPDTGQVDLANGATTGLVAFDVDPPALTWFLQVVAIGPDCAPLGGRAPDLELRAGTGLITAVPQSPATASIADENGKQVASASWTRDPDDVFTVELDITNPDLRTWSVRITNNDPEELGFVWTSAGSKTDGQQPRLAMNTTVHVTVAGTAPDVTVPVANVGPGTLTFQGTAGIDMGAGFTLKSFPASLKPNACDRLVLGVATGGSFAEPLQSTSFTLDCNDRVAANTTLQLSRDQHKIAKESEKTHKDKDKEGKEKEHKDIVGKELEAHAPLLGGPPGDRASAHFIRPELRPDLSDSALRNEDPIQRPDGE